MLFRSTAATANGYPWVVKEDGNRRAREVMESCFYPGDSHWRGLGHISASGLYIQDDFARYDAKLKFKVTEFPAEEPPGCRCGELLRGVITPLDCTLFGRRCTPVSPVGPCMVSSEGACAAYWGDALKQNDQQIGVSGSSQ